MLDAKARNNFEYMFYDTFSVFGSFYVLLILYCFVSYIVGNGSIYALFRQVHGTDLILYTTYFLMIFIACVILVGIYFVYMGFGVLVCKMLPVFILLYWYVPHISIQFLFGFASFMFLWEVLAVFYIMLGCGWGLGTCWKY